MGIETLDPEWLKNHRKGVRAQDAVAMYADVYDTLRRNGVFVIGLFITPPEAKAGEVSGRGADGLVCDAHYTADLLATKGSALYDTMLARGAVAKDMFYHDWNLTSITRADGRVQPRRSWFNAGASTWGKFAVRATLSGTPLLHRFLWRNLGVLLERMICTSWGDLHRYRAAKQASLSVDERQRTIVRSAASGEVVARLARARWHRTPLSLRTGLWSSGPMTPSRVTKHATAAARDGFD
jgi:anaerobic magnesium-protoporphyrin IX monomethyl ester cyclase